MHEAERGGIAAPAHIGHDPRRETNAEVRILLDQQPAPCSAPVALLRRQVHEWGNPGGPGEPPSRRLDAAAAAPDDIQDHDDQNDGDQDGEQGVEHGQGPTPNEAVHASGSTRCQVRMTLAYLIPDRIG